MTRTASLGGALPPGATELTTGQANRVWLVTPKAGPPYVLKHYGDPARAANEAAALRLLTRHQAPAPRLIDSDPAAIPPWTTQHAVTATTVPVGRLLDELAEPLDRIHRIPGTHFGRLAGARRHTRWTDYLHDRLAAYTTAAPHLAREADRLHADVDTTAPDTEPRLVHHDLQPGHLVRDATSSILLDWELAAFADPLSDLARLAVRLGTSSPDPVQCLAPHPARHARHRLELYWRIHRLADAAFNTEPR